MIGSWIQRECELAVQVCGDIHLEDLERFSTTPCDEDRFFRELESNVFAEFRYEGG